MSGHGEKLTRKQEQAVAALLAERTLGDAARTSGVAEATLRRWLVVPGFRSAYRLARRQVVEAAVSGVQQAAAEAVEALRRNLTCGRPAAEIKAAAVILDTALRGVEVSDLEEEVEGLKAAVEEINCTFGDFLILRYNRPSLGVKHAG